MTIIYLSLFYFFAYLNFGIYTIYLPKILENLNYSHFEIGVVLASIPVIRFSLIFLFKKKLKLNNKIFILSIFAIFLSSIMFYVFIENYYIFIFANLLSGVGISLLMPYIEILTIKKLKSKYGKSRLYGSIGFIISSFLFYKFLNNYKIILLSYIISSVIFIVFALLISLEEKEHVLSYDENIKLYPNIRFWLTVFIIQISFGPYYNFFTIYEIEHGISESILPYLWSIAVICEIFILYFQDVILEKIKLETIINFSIVITSIRWLLLYLFPSMVVFSFISQSLHAISFALFYSASILYLYKHYGDNKFSLLFLTGISYGAGGIIGSISSGVLYGKFMFLFSSIISLSALLTFNKFKIKFKN